MLCLRHPAVEGVKERLEFEESTTRQPKAKANPAAQPNHIHQSSRRRKGPAFLPSEHNELPPGVAFMVQPSLIIFSMAMT